MYNIKDDVEHHHQKDKLNIKKENLLNMILGFWIVVLPILIGYGFNANTVNFVSWNFTLTGISIIILSFLSLRFLKPWCLWLTLAAGAWLMLSPWLLGYVNNTGLLLNSLILGFIIMASAAQLIPRSERPFYSKYFGSQHHH